MEEASGRYSLQSETWISQENIGHGGVGEVRRAVWKSTTKSNTGQNNQRNHKYIAVKKVLADPKYVPVQHAVSKLTEWQAFVSTMHQKEWFVELLGILLRDGYLYIIEELILEGDLRNFIKGPLLESEVRYISQKVFKTIQLMHDHERVHLDLKPSVIYLVLKRNGELQVKLSDFGISKWRPFDESAPVEQRNNAKLRGTRETAYLAPEHFAFSGDNSIFTPAVDSWSMGCIMFRLIVGSDPFQSTLEMFAYLMKGEPNLRRRLGEAGMSEPGIELIERCLKEEPDERLKTREALKHPWMKNPDRQISEALWQQLRGTERPGTALREEEAEPFEEIQHCDIDDQPTEDVPRNIEEDKTQKRKDVSNHRASRGSGWIARFFSKLGIFGYFNRRDAS